jgi:hypothetical protein
VTSSSRPASSPDDWTDSRTNALMDDGEFHAPFSLNFNPQSFVPIVQLSTPTVPCPCHVSNMDQSPSAYPGHHVPNGTSHDGLPPLTSPAIDPGLVLDAINHGNKNTSDFKPNDLTLPSRIARSTATAGPAYRPPLGSSSRTLHGLSSQPLRQHRSLPLCTRSLAPRPG